MAGVQAEQIGGVWHVREQDEDGARTYTLTCEIVLPTQERDERGRVVYTACGKPATYRAIDGASDLSGCNYDERLSCADCKAADESGGYFKDYGPLHEYEEITEEWLTDV